MTKTIIGMDCGASHSSLFVWTENRIVFERHDLPGVNLDLSISQQTRDYLLLEFEKLNEYENASWVVGMAGLDDDHEIFEAESWFRSILEASVPYADLSVISDVEMVLWAGAKTGVGIGLIAGTGSNCLGKNSLAQTKKVGGMSHLLADEGSGFSLGSKGLHLITGMVDGRSVKTPLMDEVLAYYDVKNLVSLKNYLLIQPNQKAEIAKCAPLILIAAERGESEAGRLVTDESMELVRMVTTVNESMSPELLPVFLAGSLFKNHYYYDKFIINLHRDFPGQKVSIVSPVLGAMNYYNYFSENKDI